MFSPAMSINTENYGYMKIVLKNTTRSSALQLQWQNEDNIGSWDEKHLQNALIVPQKDYTEYVVSLCDNQYWTGTVKKLKLQTALNAKKGSTNIKSITFTQFADITYLNREIKEGYLDYASEVTGKITGWTMNTTGGTIGGDMTGQNDKKGYYFGGDPSISVGGALELNNLGEGAPVEAYKEIPIQSNGKLRWEFEVNVSKVNQKTGSSLKLMNRENNKELIYLLFEENKVKCVDKDGNEQVLGNVKNNAFTAFRMDIDCNSKSFTLYGYDDNGKAKELLKNRSFNFSLAPSMIYLGTDGSLDNAMGYNGWLYKLNEAFEYFYLQDEGISPNYFESKNAILTKEGPRVKLSSTLMFAKLSDMATDDTAYLKKSFQTRSNVVDSIVAVEFAQKRDNAKIKLTSHENTAVELFTKNGDIYAHSNGKEVLILKNYIEGVNYTFKIRTYLELNKVEISVNGSEKVEVALPDSISDVDAISIETGTAEKHQIYVIYIRVMDYQPSTVPYVDSVNTVKTTQDTLVGVNWWTNDTSAADLFYNHARVFNRESVLGYTDGYNKESVDWQIKFAAENGIDFASHFFVINQDMQQYDTWVDLCDYSNEVNIAITLATDAITLNENAGTAVTSDDVLKRYLPYIRERFMRNGNYLTYDNRAVIFVYFGGAIPEWWNESICKEFDKSMQEIGYDGATLICISNQTRYAETKAAGFDYVAEYWGMVSEEIVEKTYENAQKNNLDFIAGVGHGSDARFWGEGQYIPNPLNALTSSQFYNVCLAAKEVMGRYSNDNIASKMLFAENWGEYGEGHSIAPFGDIGFGYLNQIRRVFTDADENHRNTFPSAKYDALFAPGWKAEELINKDFEAGTVNWNGTNGATLTEIISDEFMFHSKALQVTRNSKNGAVYQDVTAQILKNGKNAEYDISAYLKCYAPENVQAPLDDVRELIFIPAGDPSQAIGLSSDKKKLQYVTYNPGTPSDEVKWTVTKTSGNYYTIKNVATGQYITASASEGSWQYDGYGWLKLTMEDKLPETKKQSQVFYIADSLIESGAAIETSLNPQNVITNSNDTANDWLVVQGQTLEWAVTNIRTNSQRYTVEFTENNDADHLPKKFRSKAYIELQIQDEIGTHSYRFEGIARNEGSYQLCGKIGNLSWTGSLKSAKLIINGDYETANPFYVDFCHLLYLTPQTPHTTTFSLVGGYGGNYNDSGNDIISNDPIINQILDAGGKDIVITLNANVTIGEDILKAAQMAKVKVTFNFVDVTGKLWYSWTFDGKDKLSTDNSVNTKISYVTGYQEKIEKATRNKNNFYVSFTQKGLLPGSVEISLNVGDQFADGTLINLYSYDNTTGIITLENKKLRVADGFVKINVTQGKEYFFNTIGAINDNLVNVVTGESIALVFVIISIWGISATVILFSYFYRRRKTARRSY